MPTVDLPSASIDYLDEGDPAGTPVVFVHGLLNTGDLWAPTARELGSRVRVLRPTWPLGSHRVPVTGPFGPAEAARTIHDFLDALALEDPVLVGNDTGGALTQIALHQRPERVRRVLLTNCDAFRTFPPSPFQPFRWLSRIPGGLPVALAPSRSRAVRHHGFFGLLSTTRDDALWEQFLRPWHTDPRIRRDAVELLKRVSPAELEQATLALGAWDGELVVAWGTADRFFRESLGRRLAQVARAPFVPVPGARTYVSLDAPGRLAELIAELASSRAGGDAGHAGPEEQIALR